MHTPRKRFGQNFLVDRAAIERIVRELAPTGAEPVLEIGPGMGALTEPLLAASGKLAAVEIDRDLAGALRARLDPARFVLIERDVLDLDLGSVAELLGFAPATPLAVAGNLPYNISKPVAKRLVAQRGTVARAVLMFQKEVALRLTAEPGSRDYGPLTVLAGLAYTIERRFDLPPGAFRPAPSVVSTVTRWTPRGGTIPDGLEAALRASFAQRRKTMLANLRSGLGGEGPAREALERAQIDPRARAEQLSPASFLRLAPIFA
ncbi:MAG TPA: 16S rRNA (adenine(1518)-N(6)/adenine(1519)-N(6))-dimethyltransferase RsmA [Candidatus Polarisedimenticolaceae bacterium]